MENNEIDNALNSLEGLQQTGPGAFFYTRVRAKLQKEETGIWTQLAGLLARPVIALPTLCLILVLNVAAFIYQNQSLSGTTADQTEQISTEDYNTTLAANSYYDENTEAR